MQNGWFKIIDDGYGQISLDFGNKKVPLRFTVFQQEKLFEFQENKVKGALAVTEEAGESKNVIKKRSDDDLEICFIALNPIPNKVDFSKDDINNLLDLDQQRLIASIWMTRKVLNPSITTIQQDIEALKKGN